MDGSQEMRARLLSSGEEDNRSSDSEDLEGGRPVVPRPLPSLARAVRGRRYPKRPARRRSNSDRAEDSVRRVRAGGERIIGGGVGKEATDGERDGAAAPPRRASERHVFVFGFGCVVTWGFDRAERASSLGDPAVRAGATSAAERVEAHDTLTYVAEAPGVRGKRRGASCANDVIRLDGGDPLEKFTLAYALAQSAKLFVWEARVDVTIEDVRPIPERLAATGRTNLSETQISRMIGKIFTESTQVNLHSEILDSPNWLWEDDQHEPAYIALRDHLDVPDRVELLNKRLDILKELLEVLNTQLANSHSSRLEIIVIWLIIAEIVVTLLVFVLEHVLPKKFF
ncbi:hypothetical protein SO694_00041122 [Aureococcus anophagefferens]|uniref:DUF155 domain-containing protein n=2 Tax=Aureococcus anophagefferens TaxID=44056 RepID=A0ABR1G633_AURAN